jgi:hypothetical protein
MRRLHLIASPITSNAAGFAVGAAPVAGVPWTLTAAPSVTNPTGQTYVSASPVLFTPSDASVIGAITVTGLDRSGNTIVEVIPSATAQGATAFSTNALFATVTAIVASGSSAGATFVITAVQTGSPALYLGTITGFAALVGQDVTFSGFANAANNGTFTVTAATAAHIGVVNASAVAETDPTTLTLTAVAYAAGNNTYTGTITGGGTNNFAGATIVVAGFANAGNNGTFTVVSNSTTVIVVADAAGVTESHAATAKYGTTASAAAGGGYTIEAGWGGTNYSPWLCAGFRRASVSAAVLSSGNYNIESTDQNFLDPYSYQYYASPNNLTNNPNWPVLQGQPNQSGYEDDGTFSGSSLMSNALSLAAPATAALTVGFVTPTPQMHFAYRIVTTTAEVQLDVNVERA